MTRTASRAVAPLSLSRHVDPACCLGAAPGRPGVVKLGGAAAELHVAETEGKNAGLPVVSHTAGAGCPRVCGDLSLYPAQLVHHAGVDPGLPSPPPAVRLPEGDDAQEHLAAVEVGGGEAAPAVSVAAVRHQPLPPSRGLADLGAEGADLVAGHLGPEGPAGLRVHDGHPGGLDDVGEDSGAAPADSHPEARDVDHGAVSQQIVVSPRARQTDGNHPAGVGGDLSLQPQDGDIVTSVDIVEQVGPVPGRVESDIVNPHTSSRIRSLGEAEVDPEVLRCEPGAGGRTAPLLAIWRREREDQTD